MDAGHVTAVMCGSMKLQYICQNRHICHISFHSEMPTGLKLVHVVLSVQDTYAYRCMFLYVSMRLIVLLVRLSVFMWQTFNMLNAVLVFPTSLLSTSWSLRDLLALKHSPVKNCKHSEPHNLLSLRHFSLSHTHIRIYSLFLLPISQYFIQTCK